MDVPVSSDGLRFVWNSDKAAANQEKHGVSFAQAMSVFFDPFVRYVESGTDEESRSAAITVLRETLERHGIAEDVITEVLAETLRKSA